MRRRVASAVVVAAVAAVAVAAIVDAVRPRAAPTLDAEAASQLAQLGVVGTLIYTDADCELHALSLPGLRPAAVPTGPDVGCDISVSPDGERVAAAGAKWNAATLAYAICRGTRVDVIIPPNGRAQYSYDGCAPAWRPGGEYPGAMTLTVARDGAILAVRPTCEGQPPCEEMLVPRRELVRAAINHPNAPWRGPRDPRTLRLVPPRVKELQVRDLVWLSQQEVAALIEARFVNGLPETSTLIAAFRSGRLVSQKPYFERFDRLVVSLGGDALPEPAARPFPFVTTRIRLAGPFDWSTDGRLLVVGTRASIFVVEVASQRLVRIPVTARDLAWR